LAAWTTTKIKDLDSKMKTNSIKKNVVARIVSVGELRNGCLSLETSKGSLQQGKYPEITQTYSIKAIKASRNGILQPLHDATTGSTALPLPTATESKVPYIDSTSVALTQESCPP
jgi:hypothetical protein